MANQAGKEDFNAVESMTPVGRVEYVALNETVEDDKGLKWWKITVSWPKAQYNTELVPFRRDATKATKLHFGEIPAMLQPLFRDGDNPEHNTTNNENYYGRYYINFKAKENSRPEIVDARKNVISPLQIWAGCHARVSVLMGGYTYLGKKGVWFRVQNIQKAQEGEKRSNKPKAASQFDELTVAIDDII